MKKIFTLLLTVLIASAGLNINAEVITKEKAKTTADYLLSLDGDWRGEGDATVRLVEEDGIPAYYVVEYKNGGWALISAQSTSNPYIGYNTTGTYATPEPMQIFLDTRVKNIVATSNSGVEHKGWKLAMQRMPAEAAASAPDVEPLIPVTLSQSDPYNKYCPTLNGEKTLVGCVAVAGTQAMMIHRYPEKGEGKHSYTCPNTGKHTIDYDAEDPYDWNAVLSCKETGDYDETARILYHVGVAVNMQYNQYFSGATATDIYNALHRNFRFDKKNLNLMSRDGVSDEVWLDLILKDLTLGRTVVYVGAANEAGEGGHCWNIDGWKDKTKMVHCNWGWDGSGNGYFDINDFHDDYQGIDLNYYHGAIFGVGAPTTAPYSILLSSTKFTLGTEAGVALADVEVLCEDPEAVFEFEMLGPPNVLGNPTVSPYEVRDGKLVSTKTVANTNAFKYLKIVVTNANTGESYAREFTIQIVESGAVNSALNDALNVYPTAVESMLNIDTPVAEGEYAVYNVAGVQVLGGKVSSYTTSVDVSSLSRGTYFLRYTNADGVAVKTFLKQ